MPQEQSFATVALNFVTCWLRPLDKAALLYSFLQLTKMEQAQACTQSNTRPAHTGLHKRSVGQQLRSKVLKAAAGSPSRTVSGLVRRMLSLPRATFLGTLGLAQPVTPEPEYQHLTGLSAGSGQTPPPPLPQQPHTLTHSCTTCTGTPEFSLSQMAD